MKKRVKVGAWRTVFKGVIFTLRQAEATLPSGKVELYERAIRPASVSVLAIDNKGRLLVTREYRSKYGRYLWRLPSGRVERGEKPIDAAQRELREEVGLKAGKLKLFHLTDMGQALEWERYTYLATDLTSAPLKGEEDEDIRVIPMTLSKAMQLVKEDKIENEAMAYLIFKLYFQRRRLNPS